MRPHYDRGPLAQQTPPRTARATAAAELTYAAALVRVAILQYQGYADATQRTRAEARRALKKAKAYRGEWCASESEVTP